MQISTVFTLIQKQWGKQETERNGNKKKKEKSDMIEQHIHRDEQLENP